MLHVSNCGTSADCHIGLYANLCLRPPQPMLNLTSLRKALLAGQYAGFAHSNSPDFFYFHSTLSTAVAHGDPLYAVWRSSSARDQY